MESYSKTLPPAITEDKKAREGAGDDAATQWRPASRETEADRSGDRRSLRRRLDQRIFMLVRQKGAKQGSTSGPAPHGGWSFPIAEPEKDESTRLAAERALSEALAPDARMQRFFVGNAPAGHAELAVEGTTSFKGEGHGEGDERTCEKADEGRLLFFHRCQLIKGQPALRAGGPYTDLAWVARDELGDYIKNQTLLDLLHKML
jgi:large subunit ribosomal protein L46